MYVKVFVEVTFMIVKKNDTTFALSHESHILSIHPWFMITLIL